MTIDFHAHILPGADHGCENVAVSIRQIAAARSADIDVIVGSAHFYPYKETVSRFLDRRERSERLLRQHLTGAERPLILAGAEVYACEGMERMEQLDRLCIANTNVLLLEMPFSGWSSGLIESVLQIENRCGLKVVLAHVERYEHHPVQALLDAGLLAQVNVCSLRGWLRRKKLMPWIDSGFVAALGSDIHGEGKEYRCFKKASGYLGPYYDRIMKHSVSLLKKTLKTQPGFLQHRK